MPRKCSVCARPDRELVEATLNSGGSFREIGKRFGLALGTIHRHAKHVRRHTVRTLESPRGETEQAANRGPNWSPAPDDFSPAAHSQRRLLEARRRAGVP